MRLNFLNKRFFLSFIGVFLFAASSLQAQSLDKKTKPYDARFKNVQEILKQGKIGPGMDSLDAIIADFPQADDIYFTKAILLAQMRNQDGAIQAIKDALAIQSKPEYLSFAVDAFKSKNDADSALIYLDKLIDQDDNNTASLKRERIMLLFNGGYKDVALEYFYKTKEIATASDTLDMVGSVLLNDAGNYKAVIDLLKPWADKGTSLAQVYGQLAQAYNLSKNSKLALEYINKGIQTTKEDFLYFDLADLYRFDKKLKLSFDALKQGFQSKKVDFTDKNRIIMTLLNPKGPYTKDQLLELVNILVEVHPRIAESHMAKGQVLWLKDDKTAAQSSLAVAVSMNPYQIDAWRMLMSLDMDKGEFDQAIAHGGEALHYVSNNATILYFTSMAYLMKKDMENSRKFMEAALNNAQEESPFLQANIYGGLGDIYNSLKMYKASDAAYIEAIRLDSTNVTAMNNLAYYLSLRKERLDDATKYAAMATKLQPNNGTFEDTYAWVLFADGKYDDALVWIQKALKNTNPQTSVLLEHYGDILIKLGKTNDAIKQWNLALEKGVDSDENKLKLKKKIETKSYVE
ncbi:MULTISPECIES: tetratricopeptide repeat protein [Sphingobacterium]|uniref:tetratricopeptide repeat protein n=1 Tax=Sphingobacterium TaxID=28453 RepID=UPI000FAE43F0|nr:MULTISPECIES: tetratricopeptide repeat protein [Sphingobacterium]MCS4167057.1 tetratricopeptide (TPR) repeat protein [Sphingobacterium sp. BIGb0116]